MIANIAAPNTGKDKSQLVKAAQALLDCSNTPNKVVVMPRHWLRPDKADFRDLTVASETCVWLLPRHPDLPGPDRKEPLNDQFMIAYDSSNINLKGLETSVAVDRNLKTLQMPRDSVSWKVIGTSYTPI